MDLYWVWPEQAAKVAHPGGPSSILPRPSARPQVAGGGYQPPGKGEAQSSTSGEIVWGKPRKWGTILGEVRIKNLHGSLSTPEV